MIVADYLDRKHGKQFEWIKELSEVALAGMVRENQGKIKLSLIDGGHLFENKILDFAFLDRMCPAGGCIVFDDAGVPPVRSAINYLEANRENYVVQHPTPYMALFWKASEEDTRSWDHFRPFDVIQQRDWGVKQDFD